MKQNPAKYVRSVDFDLVRNMGHSAVRTASSMEPTEQAMAEQMALGHPLMDGAAIPNGVQSTSDESAERELVEASPSVEAPPQTPEKKKRTKSIPFIGRRSSLSRNDNIIMMGMSGI